MSPSERVRFKPGGINWKEDNIDGFFPFLKNRLFEKLTTLSDPSYADPITPVSLMQHNIQYNTSHGDSAKCTIPTSSLPSCDDLNIIFYRGLGYFFSHPC